MEVIFGFSLMRTTQSLNYLDVTVFLQADFQVMDDIAKYLL